MMMKAMLGSPFLTFQLFEISESKLNSTVKTSSNSSTSSSTVVRFQNADFLTAVKTNSLVAFTTSVRPDSAMKDNTMNVVHHHVTPKSLRVT